ncbi:hypothetical protein GCM10027030_12920 [Luteococcus sediminum]
MGALRAASQVFEALSLPCRVACRGVEVLCLTQVEDRASQHGQHRAQHAERAGQGCGASAVVLAQDSCDGASQWDGAIHDLGVGARGASQLIFRRWLVVTVGLAGAGYGLFASARWVAGLVATWKGRGMPRWPRWRKR